MALRKLEERGSRDRASSVNKKNDKKIIGYCRPAKPISTYRRARGSSACELRDAVRSKFCPRDILVGSEEEKRRTGGVRGDAHARLIDDKEEV